MTRMTAAAIAALLSMSAAQVQDGPYVREPAARTCIQKRLTELVAENRANIAADTQLTACTSDLKAEFKDGYIAWLVADENNKRNGVTGRAFSADKSFLLNCTKSETWDKH